MKQLKERRKEFQKLSTDYDSALFRSSIAPKYKISDCKEADEFLAHVKTTFSHVAFDYVCQVSSRLALVFCVCQMCKFIIDFRLMI